MTRPPLTPKIPPHSEEAEQSVLGALMTDRKCHVELCANVTADDFYFEKHRLIFTAVTTLGQQSRPVDFVTVCGFLRDRSQLESVDGMAYVGMLVNDTPGAANAMEYARMVREKSAMRRLIAISNEIGDMAYRPNGMETLDILATAEARLSEIRSQSAMENTAKPFYDHRADVVQHFTECRSARETGGTKGVLSGIPDLDQTIGGFQRQRFYGIAARPGAGKSAMLNQIAVHASRKNRRGIVFSAEMTGLEIVLRALSSESGVNLYHLLNGADEAADPAMKAYERIGDIPLWLDADTDSISGIVAQMALYKARYGIEWAAVDHIGLLQTPKFASRNDQVGFITRSLKKAAKQLDIAVIGLVQMNRASETENRRPRLNDLRDSGNIEQDLDVAIFLHTPLEARNERKKPMEIGVLKNRSGMSAWLKTIYEFDGAVQTISLPSNPYNPSDDYP